MLRKILIPAVLLSFTSFFGCAQKEPDAAGNKDLEKFMKPYTCVYTEKAIKIDGRLNEKAWDKAENLEFIQFGTLEKPLSRTEAKLLWDDKYIYVGFKAYDKDIFGYIKTHDGKTQLDDVLEFFFKPDTDKRQFYNFEINSLATVKDYYQKFPGGAGASHRWIKWNCAGLKCRVIINGTLNNCEDVDKFWTMEIAVPFAELPSMKGKIPVNGSESFFHVARYDYSVYLPADIKGRDITSCAPFPQKVKQNFHNVEHWRKLLFIK
ncbi:MAG: carbohydrate-binding family 9-like protein [Planctomycetota bacterium]|jgi:hypothetical protein